jgi:hypothetical protein
MGIEHAQADWPLGSKVQKVSGSHWRGTVVGYYSTELTASGVCIESAFEPGSVQIYPSKAIKAWEGISDV